MNSDQVTSESNDEESYRTSSSSLIKPRIQEGQFNEIIEPKKMQFSMGRIIWFSMLGCMSAVNFGYSLGYPSYHNKILKEALYVTDQMLSLYNSMVLVGALFGALIACYGTMTRFGRKFTIIMGCVFSMIGWAAHLVFVNEKLSQRFDIIWLLMAGRFLVGIGVGISSTASPVYAVEISPKKAFKYTGAFHQIGITLGFILCSTIPFITEKFDLQETVPTKFLNSRIALPSVILIFLSLQFLLTWFLPFSPPWMALKLTKTPENDEKIQKNQIKLYGNEYNYEDIYKIYEEKNNTPDDANVSIYNRQTYGAFAVVVMLFLFQQWMGINPVVFNANDIFANVGLTSSTLGTLIASSGQLIGAIVCAIVNVNVPKKIILITAAIICSITHAVLGVQFQFLQNNTTYAPLAVAMVFIFYIAFNASWGPIPFIYNAFSYSTESVGMFSGLCVMMSWAFSFCVTYPYFSLEAALLKHGTFYLFSGISLASAIFVLVFVPEIKNKDLALVPRLYKKILHFSFK